MVNDWARAEYYKALVGVLFKRLFVRKSVDYSDYVTKVAYEAILIELRNCKAVTKFPERIEWIDQSSNHVLTTRYSTMTWVESIIETIEKAKWTWIFKHVNRVYIRDDPYLYHPGKEWGIQGGTHDIWAADFVPMKRWLLPSYAVHEAGHLWQWDHGITEHNTPVHHMEIQCYMLQQMFLNDTGHSGYNLFEEDAKAKLVMSMT